MADYEHLEKRFQEIKELAWKQDSLPEYQGINAYSFVDEHYFQSMKYMYERYKLRQVHRDIAEKEVATLRLKYISDKTAEETRARSYHEFEVKKRNITQWTKQLMKPEGQSIKTLFGILFCDLIPALTNDVTGRKIKEGAGYALITGCSNLTQEEIKEIAKWIP